MHTQKTRILFINIILLFYCKHNLKTWRILAVSHENYPESGQKLWLVDVVLLALHPSAYESQKEAHGHKDQIM